MKMHETVHDLTENKLGFQVRAWKWKRSILFVPTVFNDDEVDDDSYGVLSHHWYQDMLYIRLEILESETVSCGLRIKVFEQEVCCASSLSSYRRRSMHCFDSRTSSPCLLRHQNEVVALARSSLHFFFQVSTLCFSCFRFLAFSFLSSSIYSLFLLFLHFNLIRKFIPNTPVNGLSCVSRENIPWLSWIHHYFCNCHWMTRRT